jgi:hypothetical protein
MMFFSGRGPAQPEVCLFNKNNALADFPEALTILGHNRNKVDPGLAGA